MLCGKVRVNIQKEEVEQVYLCLTNLCRPRHAGVGAMSCLLCPGQKLEIKRNI